MEQIVVQIKDKHKAKILVELLTALDFVNIVNTGEDAEASQATRDREIDFFSFSGLWANRDIGIKSIREKAWPKHDS